MRNLTYALRQLAVGLSLFVFAILAVPASFAQETTAAIQGVITDPTGAVVAGATVEATSEKLLQARRVTTDNRGYYRLSALPPGVYTLTVSGQGMTAKATNLQLNAGDLPSLNLKMAVGAETIIDVTDTLAIVDVTQSKVETTVSNEILQEIPKGRSFASVIPFAPGSRQEPLQSTSSNRNGGFQIDGASDSENVYSSDGVNISSVKSGGVGVSIPMEFVQDVQVKSSSFEAEYGGALGGVINIIQPRGTNNWHGSLFGYYRSSALNANDQCGFQGPNYYTLYNTSCGLRSVPGQGAVGRIDAPYEYYIARQDHYRIVDPGFTIGGPLLKDRLSLFASYVPDFIRIRRDANFTATNPGPRTFYQNTDTHFAFARVDYSATSKLHLFANWTNAITRSVGQLPNPESKIGQTNSSATTDPTTFRADGGWVAPSAVYSFGADYTINSTTLATVRYGYSFQNNGSRGTAQGLRYLYSGTAGASSTVQTSTGETIPTAYRNTSGFNNIGPNQPTVYDAYKRKQLTADIQHIQTGWAGTHTFKVGYAWMRQGTDTQQKFDYAYVQVFYGQNYSVGTGANVCDPIISANQTAYPAGVGTTPTGTAYTSTYGTCRGKYGYFTVVDGNNVLGKASGDSQALYIQDGWQVGHSGLTINAGVRFDKEYLPPYIPSAPSISFNFSQKVAPRIGVAYDVLHNGKLKVYGSYGKFFDLMKFGLPQGSFGGNYWHNCVYTLDNPNYTAIVPTAPAGSDGVRHGCGASGAAAGVTSNAVTDVNATGGGPGRFIENLDNRAFNNSPADPGVDPNIKPMQQHEWVVGSEFAMTPTLTISARYARKRLDWTIEDMGLNDNFGFYIGNPGTPYTDFVHRALPNIYDKAVSNNTANAAAFLNATGICPTCPAQPKAVRNYDGFEVSVQKTMGSKWFVKGFYTYSRLYGNYPGETSTFVTDSSGGRHAPSNNRSFDVPTMQFTSHGDPLSGPLPTDRPNTFQAFGSFRQKWILGESQLGLSQAIFQGTPVSTAVGTVGSTSAVQFVENQGNFVKVHLDSSGNLVSDGIIHGYRTPAYTQTDASLSHYVHVSKEHENRKFGVEMNFQNLLNQHAVMAYVEGLTTAAVNLTVPNSTNPTGYNYQLYETNWDYIGYANSLARNFSNQYGKPSIFQLARQIRIKVAYTF
ncbi:TonB-dependent receptor [Terriglobus tenax]|uniref:TonB-dependent receptor n=1 Tax=Terriglobus tenax TaxID=1111115 RepID=UPI0021DF95F4|nr:carboxypeptidase regulatory-like domain-containing protein [Terriglobus tenax]